MNDQIKKRAEFLINTAYVAVIILLVYLALRYVTGWIFPFILAFCIVSVIHPLVTRVVKILGVKREVVALIIMILVYATAGTLLFLLILQIIFTIGNALTLLPGYYAGTINPAIDTVSNAFASFMSGLPEGWKHQAETLQVNVINAIQNFLLNLSQKGIAAISALTSRIPAFMIAFVFTIMLSFFLSVQYDNVLGFIKTQLPPKAQKIVEDTKIIIIDTVFKYLRAALTLMFITFSELSIGLLILRQPNAIPIAVAIAFFDALPFFGTGAILVPWILINLVQGNFTFALGLALLYACVTFIRSLIEPKIVGDSLGLNPIVSLVSIYLGFKVFGVLGMIAMPISTQIVLQLHKKGSIRLFREKVAQDSDPVQNAETEN